MATTVGAAPAVRSRAPLYLVLRALGPSAWVEACGEPDFGWGVAGAAAGEGKDDRRNVVFDEIGCFGAGERPTM